MDVSTNALDTKIGHGDSDEIKTDKNQQF